MEEKVYTVDYILENEIDKKAYGFIYITTNLVNGKKYIGQKKFVTNWKTYLGSGILLKKSLDKYGKENFTRDIIDIADSPNVLNNLEIQYIKIYDATNNDDFYNINIGGAGTHLCGKLNASYGISPRERMDEESYENWRKNLLKSARKGKKHEYYKKHPIEIFGEDIWRKNVEVAKERWKGIQNPQKLNPRCGEKHPNYKRKYSQEEKIKMIKNRKNLKLTNSDVMKIREIYQSCQYTQKEIAIMFNISRGTISDIIHNRIYNYLPNNINFEIINNLIKMNRIDKITRKVVKIEKNQIIEQYNSVKDAASSNALSLTGIKKHLTKKVKNPKFVYYEDYIAQQNNQKVG